MPSSRFVSHVVSSSMRNGGSLSRLIEKEEERVGIGGEADLRRGDVREQRPARSDRSSSERIAQQPEELHRSLPAIARDVLDPHRRGAVLEDDEVDAALPHDAAGPCGRASATIRQAIAADEAGARTADRRPGRTARESGSIRRAASRRQSARRRAKRQIQRTTSSAGQHEQPQVLRLRERDLLEVDAGQHG